MRLLSLLAMCLLFTGCSTMLHELQPHRLWRWNYQEPAGRTDGSLFSLSDPLEAKTQLKAKTQLETESVSSHE